MESLFYLNIKNIQKERKTMLVYFSIISNDFLSLITTISKMATLSNGKRTEKQNQDSSGTKLFLENNIF